MHGHVSRARLAILVHVAAFHLLAPRENLVARWQANRTPPVALKHTLWMFLALAGRRIEGLLVARTRAHHNVMASAS